MCPTAVEHSILVEWVLDDELDRSLGSDEARHKLRPAPTRNEPQKAFGTGDVSNRRRDRARVAMQREFDAAAKAGPVDRGHRRIGQRPDPAEELVACTASLARELGIRTQRELLEVGSGGEEVRLARDYEPGPVAGLELDEHVLERLERE